MTLRLTILGSGSSGNASLLQVDGFGLLIDAGLGPRQISSRLQSIGASWDSVDVAVLTHTHADHWKLPTLAQLLRREIPLYCHGDHIAQLRQWGSVVDELQGAGLLRTYREEQQSYLAHDLWVKPIRVSHDAGPTFGFRIECDGNLFCGRVALGYISDLGMWSDQLVEQLAGVHLLAVEFNHDVAMQRSSGRPAALIARVLGDDGHLSNEQAAQLASALLHRSRRGSLQQLVQLHLSRQCNRPQLARRVAQQELNGRPIAIHTADQYRPVSIAVS